MPVAPHSSSLMGVMSRPEGLRTVEGADLREWMSPTLVPAFFQVAEGSEAAAQVAELLGRATA